MSIRKCPECGASLDPQEICDCQETKKEDNPAATGSPSKSGNSETISTNNISNPYDDVNNLLRAKQIRESAGALAKDVAEVIRETLFPKFNRQLLSQCEQWEKYGIILHPDGLRLICETYGIKLEPDLPPVKKTKRRLNRKLTFRVTDSDYERFEKRMQDDGYNTLQAWLYSIINLYMGGELSGNS